jgi:hypothetical protein
MMLWIALELLTVSANAQSSVDEFAETMVEDSLVEGMMDENGPSSIVLDITRTKIGRDFYESFYQQWSSLPLGLAANVFTDSTVANSKASAVFNLSEFVVTIEELPSASNSLANIISVSVDNELLWQQFVPSRREVIDEYATYAVEIVRGYFATIQTVTNQLGDEDQRGTGIK